MLAVRKVAEEEGVPVADVWAAWKAALAGGVKQESLLSQGNHPNREGHDLAAKVPPAGQTAEGWCLYEDDRWDGPEPQEWDDHGWIVYPDPTAAWAGLAREMRRRCDLFDSGQWPGTQLITNWYPVPITYLPDGAVRDETGAEFGPGQPW